MRFLVLRAYLKLMFFDYQLARGDFAALYERMRNHPIAKCRPAPDVIERICAAVDMASVWYWKEILCLQRSAATACLLKEQGVAAHLVLGVQQMPFKAHAWVEVNDCVVNDKPYMPQLYSVLDKC